jgi:hypothetical protein
MSRIVAIFLFSLSLLLGPFHEANAREYGPSDEETALLELINEARKDPLAMAASLGMDPNAVLRDLPEMHDVLTAGLPPLGLDEKLYRAAVDHTEEMIAHSYYAHSSLDGRTPAERIRMSGYPVAACGESLGMVAFQNLMMPEEAVRIIFETVFLAELEPATEEPRNILNPERTEAGVAFGNGQFDKGDTILNAYVATLDFAKPIMDTETVERALLAMLNAARNDPEQAILDAGLDPVKAAEAYGSLGWVLTDPLPPLAWNDILKGTAAAHNRDMRAQGYFNVFSLDGLAPFDRVAAAGYGPIHVGESLGLTSMTAAIQEEQSPFDAARKLYQQILRADVDAESGADRNVFAPFVTEVGIDIAAAFQGVEAQIVNYVVVADVAVPTEERSFVVGTVYEDKNNDDHMDDDEGIPGLTIIARSPHFVMGEEVTTTTGAAGGYQISRSRVPGDLMELHVERGPDVFGPFYVMAETAGASCLKDIGLPPQSVVDSAGSARKGQKKLDRSLRICY